MDHLLPPQGTLYIRSVQIEQVTDCSSRSMTGRGLGGHLPVTSNQLSTLMTLPGGHSPPTTYHTGGIIRPENVVEKKRAAISQDFDQVQDRTKVITAPRCNSIYLLLIGNETSAFLHPVGLFGARFLMADTMATWLQATEHVIVL